MSSMMERMNKFVEKYSMSESCKMEMLEILNESLLEISKEILERKVSSEKVKGGKNKEKEMVGKKYKSKKAEEYAEEHGINIEDFEMSEISKKDVENKVREITKNKKEGKNEVKSVVSKLPEDKVKREKVICSGINKKGECCKSIGTIQPEGAKKKYCFRHAEDYKSFECDSDSSDEEEMVEEKIVEEEMVEEETVKEKTKKLEINSDDKLFE